MLKRLGLWVARALDVLGWKSVSRSLFARLARAGDGEHVVYWAAWERMRRGDVGGAEGLLRGGFAGRGSPKVGRLLVHLLLRQGRYGEAWQVAADMQSRDPGNPWLLLLLGDLHAYFGGDGEFAAGCYERALEAARAWRGWGSPLKVVYKRLARLYWSRGDLGRLVPLLEEFASWRASNFYASGFEMLYRAHLALGNAKRAKEVLLWGLREMPRSSRLRALAREAGLEGGLAVPGPAGVSTEGGRTCVRTRLLTEVDDPVAALGEHVRSVGRSDVVALSSCVAGVMEGRFQMAGAIAPCLTARVLSRFVDQTDVPFGGMAPLASPLAMQVLVEEVGTVRVWLAALAGVVGKLLGRKGWFYLVAGPQSALIDDVPGSLPPYDYYVIMGPADPPGLAQRIADALGCEAAIVDANDRQVAWAVGCSRGVDRRRLEALMSDNPAGNQDQQTPIVIVRGACREQVVWGGAQRRAGAVAVVGAGRLAQLWAQGFAGRWCRPGAWGWLWWWCWCSSWCTGCSGVSLTRRAPGPPRYLVPVPCR
ncbi:MAG: tetratricopeptide repeat protein [Bacillota bacterium]